MAEKQQAKRKTVKVYPGEPLPQGIYLNGWKLDRVSREQPDGKPRALYLIIEEDEDHGDTT